MAGSVKDFIYTTDGGSTFGITMDEDNGERMSNPDVTASPSGLFGIPRNLEPRYALYVSESGKRQLKIPVCSNTAISDDLPQTFTVLSTDGETSDDPFDNNMRLTSLVPERYQPIVAYDTGMQDGDAA